jgi:hypothetical protein
MDTVLIAGGGIAGLTCAINLAARGIAVEVHEAKRYCGKAIRDIQYIENWMFQEDTLDTLRRCHLQPAFDYEPVHSLTVYAPSLRHATISAHSPMLYRVFRGPVPGSIDESLERQAKDHGVSIRYGSRLPVERATLVAWGPRKPTIVVAGIVFQTSASDSIQVLMDDRCAPGFYAYRSVHGGRGVLNTAFPAHRRDGRTLLERTVDTFQKIQAIPMLAARRFGYGVALGPPPSALRDGRLYVGEAAGFQDGLFGFGMRYAMLSGHLAACALTEGKHYDTLWQEVLGGLLTVGEKNRRLYDLLGNPGYEAMVRILASRNPLMGRFRRGSDARDLLAYAYTRQIPRIFRIGALLAQAFTRFAVRRQATNETTHDRMVMRQATRERMLTREATHDRMVTRED